MNDETPKFAEVDYYALISEAVTVGSEILSLAAADADHGINSQVHYKLEAIDSDRLDHTIFDIQVRESSYLCLHLPLCYCLSYCAWFYFKNMDGGEGKIVTVNKLDFEATRSLSFKVVAMDGGSPRLSSEAYVHVSLIGTIRHQPFIKRLMTNTGVYICMYLL